MQPNCATANCHDAAFAQSRLILDSANARATLIARGELIAGEPNSSIVYLKMTGHGGSIMPPAGQLDTVQTNEVYYWILQGAKDN